MDILKECIKNHTNEYDIVLDYIILDFLSIEELINLSYDNNYFVVIDGILKIMDHNKISWVRWISQLTVRKYILIDNPSLIKLNNYDILSIIRDNEFDDALFDDLICYINSNPDIILNRINYELFKNIPTMKKFREYLFNNRRIKINIQIIKALCGFIPIVLDTIKYVLDYELIDLNENNNELLAWCIIERRNINIIKLLIEYGATITIDSLKFHTQISKDKITNLENTCSVLNSVCGVDTKLMLMLLALQ